MRLGRGHIAGKGRRAYYGELTGWYKYEVKKTPARQRGAGRDSTPFDGPAELPTMAWRPGARIAWWLEWVSPGFDGRTNCQRGLPAGVNEQVGKRLLFGSTCSAMESGMACEWRSPCGSQLRPISMFCACPQTGKERWGGRDVLLGNAIPSSSAPRRYIQRSCLRAVWPLLFSARESAVSSAVTRSCCTSVGASGRSPERWPEFRGLPSTSLAQGRPPMSPDFVNKYHLRREAHRRG